MIDRRFFPVLLSVLLAACSPETEAPSGGADPLASGSGVAVTADDLETELALMSDQERAKALGSAKALQSAITSVFYRRRMEDIASERGYLDDPTLQQRIARNREMIIANAVPEMYLAELEQPDFEARAREYYEANSEEFRPPERIAASHIFWQAPSDDDKKRVREEAESVLEQLRNGAEFGALATEHSQDGSRYARGELGTFKRGDMAPGFEEAAFALKEAGDISGIVESRFGLHIIKLDKRYPNAVPPFEEVRGRIVQRLRNEFRHEKVSAWLKDKVPSSETAVAEPELSAALERMRERYGAPERDESAGGKAASSSVAPGEPVSPDEGEDLAR
ncbi:peptidylprolyl isomerase [Algiphilus sp.]|uniref:peptidylprolyl isomerase n=1 Tax=Algiphilus sp. TaxID=1872431 RepID=UPI0025BB5717|nr:peptidylprolyl isomerase [Algiphilus sp.]MCK5768895.1 peptidylprolyl isomerase [Algiphilus sp.]